MSAFVREATRSEAVEAAVNRDVRPPIATNASSDDLVNWPTVPAGVRDIVLTLRDVQHDRHAPLMGISDDMRHQRENLLAAESRLREIAKDARIRSGLSDIDESHPEVVNTKQRIADATRKLNRLTARHDDLQGAWQQAAALSRNIENYIRNNHADGITLFEGALSQLRNGETALDGWERASRRTRTLQADRREILAAPFPTALAKKMVREQFEKRIAAVRPDVSGLVDRLDEIEFPQVRTSLQTYGTAGAVNVVDPIGLLAWLLPKDFYAAIDKAIDEAGDDKAALSPEQRAEKIEQIDGDILASEREEAQFAELAGLLPRADIDPRAVLNLSAAMPVPTRR